MADSQNIEQDESARNPDLVAIFFRGDRWYPIELRAPADCGRTLQQQATDQAELNPGTTRVEDIHGNVLWRPQ